MNKKRLHGFARTSALAVFFLLTHLADTFGVPAILPDPDGSTGATNKPVKVFILSGQSNMVGFGRRDGNEPGTLEYITSQLGLFPNLVDGGGGWTTRNDVMYRGVISAIGNGPLYPQFGANTGSFGPELGFGHVLGWYFDEPVILIKTSIGNRSLGWDCLPPGSPRYDYGVNTYAGYGDAPANWPTNGAPSPAGWYAGKQYDDYFLDEADMDPNQVWADGIAFPNGCQVKHGGVVYDAKSAHTASPNSEPGVGAQWTTYWNVHSVFNVTDILDNFAAEYPAYAAQGFEIAGFAWWQGHKDQYDTSYASRYETNMVNFINELRAYYVDRYPGQIATNAPFALATVAFNGWDISGNLLTIANGQLAVSGETGNYPLFKDNVKTIEARGFWREFGPSTQDYHYYHNAETYMLVGDTLGRVMVAMLGGTNEPPNPNPMGFEVFPATVDASTITMTALTAYDTTAVEYFFTNTVNGDTLGWSTNLTWVNSGLPMGPYGYRVKARDAEGNETAWSPEASADATNDTVAPVPNPMTFAVLPSSQANGTAIDMTATTATDAYGSDPVMYYFENTNTLANSGWIPGTNWTDSPVIDGQPYGYRVRARDAFTNITDWSAVALVTAQHETNPPAPNPMAFAILPAAVNDTSIDMTAFTATDPSGPVEYFFTNMVNGDTRDWDTNTVWMNTGLTEGVTNCYIVRARDAYSNETAWSTSACAVAENDIFPPEPDPMTFLYAPVGISATSITMTATTATDLNGPVEYYFENTSNGHVRGWNTDPFWTDTNLIRGETYGYRVKAQDALSNATAWSAVELASPANVSLVIYEPFEDNDPSLSGNVPGAGLTGTWNASGSFSADPGSLSYGYLPTSGNKALYGDYGGSTFGNAVSSVAIDGGLADSGLLANGATLWFSVLVKSPKDGGVNPDTGFAIGTDGLGGGNNIPMQNSGQGIGWSIKRNKLLASTWNGAISRTDSGSVITNETLYLMVGEIVWGATDGDADMINLYLPDETLNQGGVMSSWSNVLDQASFDTIASSLKNNKGYAYDEIRVGVTYADVVPRGLMLFKTVSETNAFFGGSLTYTLDVLNLHTTALGGIVITDSLPAEVTFDASEPSADRTNGNDYIWDVDPLATGEQAQIIIHVTVNTPGPGTITNAATVITTNPVPRPSVQAVATTPILAVEDILAVTKTVSETNLLYGFNLTYTIIVTNISPNPAMGVEVTDTLPAGIALVTSAPSADTNVGNRYIYQFGTLAGGAGASIVISAELVTTLPGVFTNLAVAVNTNGEVQTVNNEDTAITVVGDVDEDGVSDPFDPDDDNDRMPDADELIAGTLPQDSNSFLWVAIAKTNITERVLTFPGVTGRTYHVQVRTNLLLAPWVDVETGISGPALSNTLMEIHRTNAWDRVYYRIGVERP